MMTPIRFRLTVLLLCLFVSGLGAQQKFSGDEADKRFKGSTLIVIGKGSKVPTFIQMGETSNYPVSDFTKITRALLCMRDSDELKEMKKGKDYLGFVHHHFDQQYMGLPVEGGNYVMHEKNGRIITLDGFFIDSIRVGITPGVTADMALAFALKESGAKKFRWEDIQEEANLRKALKDSNATWHPAPELCIASKNLDNLNREMHLCYRIDVQTIDPPGDQVIFVDAVTLTLTGKKTVAAKQK